MTPNIDSIYTIKDESSITRCSTCDNKIAPVNFWRSQFDCGDHKHPSSVIAEYCDCSEDRVDCHLTKEYLKNVEKLQHKKNSASDLNIFEVSKNLYGN